MRRGVQKQDPYIGAGITLAVVLFILYVIPGYLVPVTAHFEGDCRAIALDASAEDLRIDPANGLVYLTYYDRPRDPDGKPPHGSVMLVDPNAAEPHVRAALTTELERFAPAGLSLFTPASGPKQLFVINRLGPGRHSIEIFEQSPTGTFTAVQTVKDPLLRSPTAIVAVGPKQFYAVNDSGVRASNDFGRRNLERLRGNYGTVVYFDGSSMKVVATRLNFANGVAVSPDGRTLYVAESSERHLQLFDRDVATGALKPGERIELHTSPRNIMVDADGTVWVSAQPNVIPILETLLFRRLRDSSDLVPTQVLKVTPGAPRGQQVSEVYMNAGEQLSSGTVVAAHGDELVLGSATNHKLLLCKRAPASSQSAKPVITGPEKED